MRPGRRLLVLGVVALGVTVLILASGMAPPLAALLVWVGLGAIALLDLLAAPGPGRLRLEVDPPPGDVFSGETARLPARLTAPGRKVPAILDALAEIPEDLGAQVAVSFIPAGPDGAVGEIRIPAKKRGLFEVPAMWLRWASPLGLWEITPRFALDISFRVVPNIRPVTSGRIDVTVRSALYGVKDTITRGEGSEFHQLREFVTGMDHRAIDWKRSARHTSLVAKEMRAERNHQIILALDNGYLMRGEIEGLAKVDHAINAALTVAWAAGLGGDLVGLYSFDAEPRHFTPPQPGRAVFPLLRRQTADMTYSTVESNHTLALAHLNGLLSRRSLIVIFSDFADTTTAELLVENLQVLNKMHVILFVILRDPVLESLQGGQARSLDQLAEAVVAADMLRERQVVLDRLARIGVLCLETAPGKLTPRLLSSYLDIKARELI